MNHTLSNKEIAAQFRLLGNLMELHDGNAFKIKSYLNAYRNIRSQTEPLILKEPHELLQIAGIGKTTAAKIEEIKTHGSISALQELLDKTPEGIIQILSIKGLGAKKVKQLWQELEIESAGELLYACEENRLIELKGFGAKSQATIRQQVAYHLDSRGKYLYGHIYPESQEIIALLQSSFSAYKWALGKDILRKMPVLDGITIITNCPTSTYTAKLLAHEDIEDHEGTLLYKNIKLEILSAPTEKMGAQIFESSCSPSFLEVWQQDYPSLSQGGTPEEFSALNLAYIPPEYRESPDTIAQAKQVQDLELLELKHLKGLIHAHSTYSDGSHSISEMADACRKRGLSYMVITDHSRAAFYANGLSIDSVYQQWEEIDHYNQAHADFRIFKGIESDILSDGSLDYPDDILSGFEFIIASIHSNLRMDQHKATTRLLRAIEHPATTMIGHPTGRLLLSREGYPIDHQTIIDACATYQVGIELNANPYRMDLDWQWIPYAIEKGVKLSINPDAHSINGIDDTQYGVATARKAGVKAQDCLNSMNSDTLARYLMEKTS